VVAQDPADGHAAGVVAGGELGKGLAGLVAGGDLGGPGGGAGRVAAGTRTAGGDTLFVQDLGDGVAADVAVC
jgi:hypothetical protein